ncbi:protein-lysine N-trimethyltransferase SMYD5-like [Tubulanus polymorphus]|uniref:protein-lysine N-trimethyltransferase SMYD5-like n=1 Tax=Tubulanus polymorphus TaxID=672921 RepID=UPI003DA6015C
MAAPMENARISHISGKGRCLIAQRYLTNGSTIFEEQPLISSQYLWNAFYNYTACDHCMKSLETAESMARRLTANHGLELPYKQCCETNPNNHVSCPACRVVYCSEECRLQALKSYHESLCLKDRINDPEHPINKLQETWRSMHYPPETASIMIIVRLLASIKQSANKPELLEKLGTFCHTAVNDQEQIVHKLLGEKFQEQIEILRLMISELFYTDDVKDLFTPSGFRSVIALLGTNGQGIGTSALSVWEKNVDKLPVTDAEKQQIESYLDKLYEDMDKESGCFLACEGTGLFTMQAACNHSCNPNAECTFPYNTNTLVVVATDDIKAGQEICTCYLDECMRQRSRHTRQKFLKENYLFTCHCVKCEAEKDEPDITSEEESEDEDMDS